MAPHKPEKSFNDHRNSKVMWLPLILLIIALALSAIALLGCQDIPPPATAMPDGPVVKTPGQMIDFCRRNPGDTRC